MASGSPGILARAYFRVKPFIPRRVGWGLRRFFICYKADRLVALNTQLMNLVKATTLASFWLMIGRPCLRK